MKTDAVAVRFNQLPSDTIGNEVVLQIRELAVYVVEGDIKPIPDQSAIVLMIVIYCLVAVFLIVIIITVFVVLKHRRSIAAKCRRDTSDDELEVCETPQIRELPEPTEEQALIELQPLPSYPDWFTSNLQSKLRDRLIEPSQLVVHSELVHKGKFGAIYKGTCRGVEGRDQIVCAVKTIAGIL